MRSGRTLDTSGNALFKEVWNKKESVGPVPTRNILLLAHEQAWDQPEELAEPSPPCLPSAQDHHGLPEENVVLCGVLSVNR